MASRDIIAALLLMVFLGILTGFASQKTANPNTTGALAAAVQADTVDLLGESTFAVDDTTMLLFLCIEHSVDIDYPKLHALLSRTILKPVPMSECSSKTVRTDFGMFTELTDFYGPDGSQAFDTKVTRIECPASNSCEVDLDHHYGGNTFVVSRTAGRWQVTDRRRRWVV
ncbi:hypothetical protein [Paraurantiacibacter namhicola]|uniref:Uncharacterized protein n=1 Tax=Paraurantiacibacter namhicola TaxID=645517 RepID=A0A1C7D911_9SPHN|nr:hypothetical protein [Paraurantiacibacter namhicola]ANU07801.1 hypothetical protein A6F65_01498 [Paraurantiacibacter namhicola]